MKKRTKAESEYLKNRAWVESTDGQTKYDLARADAQKRADETGFDHGIEGNYLFRSFSVFMLPNKANRFGHELRCEVVMCSDLAKCQTGHGPMAKG